MKSVEKWWLEVVTLKQLDPCDQTFMISIKEIEG